MHIAINGLGRIGRNFLRAVLLNKQEHALDVVAANIGPMNKETAAYLFKYDTILGTYPEQVRLEDNYLVVGKKRIQLFNILDPLELDWKELNIDWVVECSGKFTHRDGAEKHIKAGAKYVLISAPAKGEDVTIIPGVNDALFDKKNHHIVSLGSCTTNALVPMLKVLHDNFGIENGYFTTIHAYTNSQVLLDTADSDFRRSRAAAVNIIPTTTGATKSVAKVMPELKDKIDGRAVRVPVDDVSLVDLIINTEKIMTTDSINKAFEQVAKSSMAGIVQVSYEHLVSSDYKGSNYSVTIDSLLTQASGKMAKIFGWYDNEWGYSMRLKDFLLEQI